MEFEYIRLTPKNIAQGMDFLRDMKGLKIVGVPDDQDRAWPPAEFW